MADEPEVTTQETSAPEAPVSTEPALSTSIREVLGSKIPEFAQFESDDQALETIQRQYQQVQQYTQAAPQIQRAMQEAQQFRAIAPDWQAFQTWKAEQEKAKAQPAPEKPKWSAPDFDPRWMQLVKRDEEGNLVPIPGADPMLGQKITEWQSFASDQINRFLKQPVEFLNGIGLEERIAQAVEQKAQALIEERLGAFQQSFVQQQQQAALAQALQEDLDKFYEHQNGQPVYDPYGNPVLTQKGQAFNAFVQKAVQIGIQDPFARLDYAKQMLAAQFPDAPEVKPEPSKTVQSLTRRPNRSGTIARAADPSAPSQNPHTMLRDSMRAQLQERGLTTR